jgi:hypothetical protein
MKEDRSIAAVSNLQMHVSRAKQIENRARISTPTDCDKTRNSRSECCELMKDEKSTEVMKTMQILKNPDSKS